ncbi:hypothetical protein AAZX31_14G137800 [Glycine max]
MIAFGQTYEMVCMEKLFSNGHNNYPNSKSVNSVSSCKLKGIQVVPLEESSILEELVVKGTKSVSVQEEDTEQYFSNINFVIFRFPLCNINFVIFRFPLCNINFCKW